MKVKKIIFMLLICCTAFSCSLVQTNQSEENESTQNNISGSVWYSGSTEPDKNLGKINDFYLRTSNWDVYKKATINDWTVVGNIKGKDGINGTNGKDGVDGKDGINGTNGKDGADGKDGIDGIDGATWIVGNGNPFSTQGKEGDLYLDSSTFDIYIYKENNWLLLGNIKGDDAVHANELLTVKFDTNDGVLPDGYTQIVQIEYGSVLDLPIPTRSNYTFAGWWTGMSVNDGQYTSVTPVMKDITLYAKWYVNEQYEIHFEVNGGNDISNKKYYADENINFLPEPSKYDCAFDGWFVDSDLTQRIAFPLKLTKDMTIYASWKKASYTLTFETNGGYEIDSQTVEAGACIELPIPSKDNCIFEGWYKDISLTVVVNNNYEIHYNQTLYAKWKDKTYTISFASDHGTYIDNITYISGTKIYSLPTPVREDYMFNGWYKDSDLKNKVTYPFNISNDETFFASWTANFIGISSFSQLQSISSNLNSNYKLLNDIDCKNNSINTIGSETKPFSGTFNGNNFHLKNINIKLSTISDEMVGIFGANTGTIKNLRVDNFKIDINVIEDNENKINYLLKIGFISANYGEVYNVEVNSNISVIIHSYRPFLKPKIYIGGIVAINTGSIQNILFKGNIYKDIYNRYSGLASNSSSSLISIFTGLICAKSYKNGLLEKCVSIGDVKNVSYVKYSYSYQTLIGGICALNDATIRQCMYANGTLPEGSYKPNYIKIVSSNSIGFTYSNNSLAKFSKCYSFNKILANEEISSELSSAYLNYSLFNSVSISNLNNASWYTNPSYLNLSNSIWCLDNLDYENYIYPTLN